MNIKPVTDEDYVEMLTTDDDGNAIPGTMYPRTADVVKWLPEYSELPADVRIAYSHKFFKRDKHGQPVEGSLVRFLVPDYLCDGPHRPSLRALALVAERMGWNDPTAHETAHDPTQTRP